MQLRFGGRLISTEATKDTDRRRIGSLGARRVVLLVNGGPRRGGGVTVQRTDTTRSRRGGCCALLLYQLLLVVLNSGYYRGVGVRQSDGFYRTTEMVRGVEGGGGCGDVKIARVTVVIIINIMVNVRSGGAVGGLSLQHLSALPPWTRRSKARV